MVAGIALLTGMATAVPFLGLLERLVGQGGRLKKNQTSPLRAVVLATIIASLSPAVGMADVLQNTLASMTPNSWRKINANQFQDVWTPADQRPTLDSPESNISSWSGAAWDSARKDILIWGGNIGNEQGNEVYVFHTTTGLWERGALPSQITQTGIVTHTVDGVRSAPVSGESWDNVVYLPGVDRMAVIGVSREGITFQNLDGSATGPYFWDPSRADPAKVSGLTGSHVNPGLFPYVVGGEMWQNRDNFAPDRNIAALGTTAHVTSGGNDVVYFAGRSDQLWRYTVQDLNPMNDRWELIGTRTASGGDGRGAGDFDPKRGIFLQTFASRSFGFWDVNNTVDWTKNREVEVTPVVTSGTPPSDYQNFGLQYDPVLEGFLLWAGDQNVWLLEPPDDLDPDGDGIQSEATGWALSALNPAGSGPLIPVKYTGVYGKWMYLPEERAYLGVIDPVSGDVFVYKPPARRGGSGEDLSLKLGVSEVVGCKKVVGTVKLGAPAATDRVVSISDTLDAAVAPATVTIPAGATLKSFSISTSAVAKNQAGSIIATLDGTTASQPLTLRPIAPYSLVYKPTSVVGGTLQEATGTLKLECRAGPGPISVDLTSDRPEAAFPVASSIAVPEGLQSTTFKVLSKQVYGKTLAPISATANGKTKTRSITVLPWAYVDPPTSLKFKGVVVGTTSPELHATLSNRGVGSIAVTGIGVTGTGASWFAQSHDCPASLGPGDSCTIAVTFSPLSESSKSARLSVATSATASPLTVLLSGTGLPPP